MKQIFIAVDQLANAVLLGWADETISARAHRLQNKHPHWKTARIAIDRLFFWQDDHCHQAYWTERERGQIAPEYRV